MGRGKDWSDNENDHLKKPPALPGLGTITYCPISSTWNCAASQYCWASVTWDNGIYGKGYQIQNHEMPASTKEFIVVHNTGK